MEDFGGFSRLSCIRGYHIYKDVWEAAVGEVLACLREPDNDADRYAVAVKKDAFVIGHLPRKMSRMCVHCFLGVEGLWIAQ